MKEYIIAVVIAWAAKKIIDFGVKKSKATENKVDDYIFKYAKIFVDLVSTLFMNKFNKKSK